MKITISHAHGAVTWSAGSDSRNSRKITPGDACKRAGWLVIAGTGNNPSVDLSGRCCLPGGIVSRDEALALARELFDAGTDSLLETLAGEMRVGLAVPLCPVCGKPADESTGVWLSVASGRSCCSKECASRDVLLESHEADLADVVLGGEG